MNTDQYVEKYMMDNFSFFKHIDPNAITILGMFFNILIYKEIICSSNKKINMYILALLFVIRWLLDDLDGAVARKYNKKSKIGGTLDTISDYMLCAIIVYYFITKLKLSKIWYLIVITVFGFFTTYYNNIHDHDSLKKYHNHHYF